MEWGLAGVEALAPHSDVMIIVDVLSFTTCVDIAIGRGGVVYPYRGTAETCPNSPPAEERSMPRPTVPSTTASPSLPPRW